MTEEMIEEFSAQKALLHILAVLYNTPVESKSLDALKMITETGLPELDALVQHAKNSNLLDIQKDWTKIFRGISLSYGPKPPYEELFSTNTMAAIAARYAKHGFVSAIDNRVDYIGVELEYLSTLSDYEEFSTFAASCKIWFSKYAEAAGEQISTEFCKALIKATIEILDI